MASSTNSISPNGTSNFMPGLASGLDTEDMVEKLLAGTQAKIDKQNAKKQQIEWKQEIYRDVITKINSFADNYFSFYGTKNTNLLSSSFYNVMTGTSSSGAVKVVSAKSTASPNVVIDSVKRLAQAYKGSTIDGHTLSNQLEGNINVGAFNDPDKEYAFDLTLDGVKKTIKFKGAANAAGVESSINAGLQKVFGGTIQADIQSSSGTDILKFKFNDEAGGNKTTHQIILQSTTVGDSSDVVTENVLSNMGMASGSTNKLNYNTYLSNSPFSTALQGREFVFSINGTEIKATSEDTVGDIINRINNSEAGVRLTYSSIDDKFVLESSNTGDISGITITQSKGNLMTAMFGLASGTTNGEDGVLGTSKGLRNTDTITGAPVDNNLFQAALDGIKTQDSVISFNVNGRDYSVRVPLKEGGYTSAGDYVTALNQSLAATFGVDSAGDNKIEVRMTSVDADHSQFELVSKAGYQVSFGKKNIEGMFTGQLGFSDGQTQMAVTSNTKLGMLIENQNFVDAGAAINVGSTQIAVNGNMTIQDLMDRMKQELTAQNGGDPVTVGFNDTTGELEISGITQPISITSGGTGKDIMKALFVNDQMNFNQFQGDPDHLDIKTIQQGENAQIVVNGNVIERNTNSFDLDGITIELKAVTGAGDGPISLTTSKDTDKIVEGLKGFVDDYNSLIEELNEQVNAKANFQKYPPLTDAQKKEMSEKEIEKWEEKAKEGLLRYDTNISKFLQDMRSAMYQKIGSAGLALYDIGIEASSNYKDNGKLILDESKLKSALSTNLDKIQQMFTDKDNGIAVRLQKLVKEAANASSGSPGLLVRYAGAKDVMETSNSLYYELKGISETLTKLNTKYKNERTRYWKQFTEMEKAISNMNSQSSWLSQQFS